MRMRRRRHCRRAARNTWATAANGPAALHSLLGVCGHQHRLQQADMTPSYHQVGIVSPSNLVVHRHSMLPCRLHAACSSAGSMTAPPAPTRQPCGQTDYWPQLLQQCHKQLSQMVRESPKDRKVMVQLEGMAGTPAGCTCCSQKAGRGAWYMTEGQGQGWTQHKARACKVFQKARHGQQLCCATRSAQKLKT